MLKELFKGYIKSLMSARFNMKDLGQTNVILGVKLIKSLERIALFFAHSVEKMIKKFSYSD